MNNPLLEMDGLPAFSRIKPDHVEPALDHLLSHNREQIEALLKGAQRFTWNNLVEPMERLDDRLSRAWSPVSHMNSVVNNEALRSAYNTCLPKLSEYGTEMGQNAELFAAFKAVAEQQKDLNPVQHKVLDDALLDFHLSGVDLSADKKTRFKEISQSLSTLTTKFEENLLDVRARSRGAEILGFVDGYASNTCHGHLTRPSMEHEIDVMGDALKSAGMTPDDVDYIHAHGTGTEANDVIETDAIKAVFGERAADVPMTSGKWGILWVLRVSLG